MRLSDGQSARPHVPVTLTHDPPPPPVDSRFDAGIPEGAQGTMVTASPSIIERLPPHNLEAEQSVLGSLLIDRDAIIKVAAFLRAGGFLRQRERPDLPRHPRPLQPARTDRLRHPRRRAAAQEPVRPGRRVCPTSPACCNAVPTAVHVEYYARIVERTATLRRLIDAGTKIVDIGFREGIDTEDALDAAERAIFDVSQRRQTKDFVSMGEVLDKLLRPDRLPAAAPGRGRRRGDRLLRPGPD